MYCKHLVLIFFLLASLKCLAQEAVRLNIKLYPIQTISVSTNNSEASVEKASIVSESRYIKVSSLSGFQVKMHQEVYNAEKRAFSGENNYNNAYAIIDKRKGGIDEKIAIDSNFHSESEVEKNSSDSKSIYHTLVYTIISQ